LAGSGQVGRRGIARLLLVCAVLAGLFLMHGAPAGAAEGCHGAVPASAGMRQDPAAAMPAAAHGAMAHPGSERPQRFAAPSATHGVMCVSTPAKERTPLPAGALPTVVAGPATAVLVGRPVALGRSGRRGPPPPGGRTLLLQVGIARR
jgi:hypothetical protein